MRLRLSLVAVVLGLGWLTACGRPEPEPEPVIDPVAEAAAAAAASQPPEPEYQPFRFVAYGDCRSRPEKHRQVVAGILASEPELVIQTGDLVGDGSDANLWQQTLEIIAPLRQLGPYYPAWGNHEKGTPSLMALFPEMPEETVEDRYYTFVTGPVRFICLDTNTLRLNKDQAQLDWLEEVLAANDLPHVVAFFHHPLWSIGAYAPGDVAVRRALHPIFRRHGVKLTFAAHDHGYYRTERDGVTHVITAGGGAPLYNQDAAKAQAGDVFAKVLHHVVVEADATRLAARVIDVDGVEVDRFEVGPTEPEPEPEPASETTEVPAS